MNTTKIKKLGKEFQPHKTGMLYALVDTDGKVGEWVSNDLPPGKPETREDLKMFIELHHPRHITVIDEQRGMFNGRWNKRLERYQPEGLGMWSCENLWEVI